MNTKPEIRSAQDLLNTIKDYQANHVTESTVMTLAQYAKLGKEANEPSLRARPRFVRAASGATLLLLHLPTLIQRNAVTSTRSFTDLLYAAFNEFLLPVYYSVNPLLGILIETKIESDYQRKFGDRSLLSTYNQAVLKTLISDLDYDTELHDRMRTALHSVLPTLASPHVATRLTRYLTNDGREAQPHLVNNLIMLHVNVKLSRNLIRDTTRNYTVAPPDKGTRLPFYPDPKVSIATWPAVYAAMAPANSWSFLHYLGEGKLLDPSLTVDSPEHLSDQQLTDLIGSASVNYGVIRDYATGHVYINPVHVDATIWPAKWSASPKYDQLKLTDPLTRKHRFSSSVLTRLKRTLPKHSTTRDFCTSLTTADSHAALPPAVELWDAVGIASVIRVNTSEMYESVNLQAKYSPVSSNPRTYMPVLNDKEVEQVTKRRRETTRNARLRKSISKSYTIFFKSFVCNIVNVQGKTWYYVPGAPIPDDGGNALHWLPFYSAEEDRVLPYYTLNRLITWLDLFWTDATWDRAHPGVDREIVKDVLIDYKQKSLRDLSMKIKYAIQTKAWDNIYKFKHVNPIVRKEEDHTRRAKVRVVPKTAKPKKPSTEYTLSYKVGVDTYELTVPNDTWDAKEVTEMLYMLRPALDTRHLHIYKSHTTQTVTKLARTLREQLYAKGCFQTFYLPHARYDARMYRNNKVDRAVLGAQLYDPPDYKQYYLDNAGDAVYAEYITSTKEKK